MQTPDHPMNSVIHSLRVLSSVSDLLSLHSNTFSPSPSDWLTKVGVEARLVPQDLLISPSSSSRRDSLLVVAARLSSMFSSSSFRDEGASFLSWTLGKSRREDAEEGLAEAEPEEELVLPLEAAGIERESMSPLLIRQPSSQYSILSPSALTV